MNKQLFIKEIELAAKKLGLRSSLGDDGRIQIQKDGAELCRVNDEGAVFFRESDLERCGGKSILSAFSNSVNEICEYLTAMEVVPFLKARGIDEWKQLCEFNRVVLACHTSRVGIQFVTWERNYDGSGVNNGHYFSDYQNAKRDFAVRAGLMPRNEILTKEELETMRSINHITDNRMRMTPLICHASGGIGMRMATVKMLSFCVVISEPPYRSATVRMEARP